MIKLMQALRLCTKEKLSIFLLACFICVEPSVLSAAVYLTPKEVLAQFFKSSKVVVAAEKAIDAEAKQALEKELGYALKRDSVTFYIGKTGDRVDGYALMDHQIGKTQPITFMTLINPRGEVEQVEVLAYRESHGSEVRHQRFLQQYHHKNKQAPLKLGLDIANITGATLSARAISIGVKRALVLWAYFF